MVGGVPSNINDHLAADECEECGGVMIIVHYLQEDRIANFECTRCDNRQKLTFYEIEHELDLKLIEDFQLFKDIKLWKMNIKEREEIFEDYSYEELEEEVKKP